MASGSSASRTPSATQLYRTFRWGRGVQVWLVEGRDFRSPNPMADGPEKTIWGDEQKALAEADRSWRATPTGRSSISPTPLVGPDRPNKKDNHANETFAHEGDEIRRWIAENVPETLFVICGDRHWQYHSVHPETGLNEFSCGPASDAHAGGTPGFDPTYHRFHRVKGGFLTVDVEPKADASTITFRHRDVDGAHAFTNSRRRGKSPDRPRPGRIGLLELDDEFGLLAQFERSHALQRLQPIGAGLPHFEGVGSFAIHAGLVLSAIGSQGVDDLAIGLVDHLDDRVIHPLDPDFGQECNRRAAVVVDLADGDWPAVVLRAGGGVVGST